MDIPALDTSMAQAKLAQDVGVSMLKKTMDQMEQTGEQISEMLKAASGFTIDIKA